VGRHYGSYVSYLRVSTTQQGGTGLGVEAQRQAITDWLNGGRWELVAEVVEVESGKRSDRPKLKGAIELCKVHGAKLLIAKLDRLARNVAFVSNLMESGVEFEALDCPQANRFTIHVLAAVAEHEASLISQRTKAALAAAKARGVRLGNPQGAKPFAGTRVVGAARSVEVRKQTADARAERLRDVLAEIEASGTTSANAMAAALSERRIATPRGGKWTAGAVINLRKRLG